MTNPASEPVALPRRGLALVIASPSGAGKSTISRSLIQNDRDLRLSVSVTTRARRPSEVEGVHYRFLGVREFESMRERGDLLEWAEVHGNLYGTPRGPVEEALGQGRDMLFDIDWQGTVQVYDKLRTAERDDVATVFILPPSMAELRARLERRAEDSAEAIERRLVNARREIEEWPRFDYVVINSDVNRAHEEVRAILAAERLKRPRRLGLADFVGGLLG